ncbi:MAG: pantetheine-phosphate adenylyltransferase [Anaerolineae bacterium]|jgi:pantetheine-phosphate adenylyltransferase|nr:pantetheine-phosphate adenylyltransferase [Anaerolineae bacterium]
MRVAIYPGSFDPIHNGHTDIAMRAASLFDKLIVAIYAVPQKSLLFQIEERVALARAILESCSNIEVMPYTGLTVDLARRCGAQTLVRGLRVISDFEREYQMALMNQQLSSSVETICLMTRYEYAFVSASLVKEVFEAGGDVSGMVHPLALRALHARRQPAGCGRSAASDEL